MASRAVCLSIMAASPSAGRGGRRRRRRSRRRRYRAISTFLTCPGIDLIYERATVFERGFSLDCIRHHYDSTQRCSWTLERVRQRSFFGRAYVNSAECADVKESVQKGRILPSSPLARPLPAPGPPPVLPPLSLSETYALKYWWCSPPRTGIASVRPTVWTVRGIGASFCSERCVRPSL